MGALLSVVVPIYNVARYLTECLDSLAAQTHADVEFILVDDGSTDGSGDIAAARAAADPRFQLIRQPNRGLGAARNTGIRAATGDYLAFADSDDVLPLYAYEVLVGTLESTGSQIVSGNVALFNSRGLWQSPLHRGTHRQTWLGVRLRSRRNLVYDRLACNKVFRRDFWADHDLWFPEGVRYEDIPVTIPAYALAETIDVLPVVVYHWRQREAGAEESISQRQAEVANLVDRFAAVRSASRALAAVGDRAMKKHYDTTALRSDLRMFLHLLPDVADAGYRQRFLELAGEFLTEVEPVVLDRLDPGLRVAWRLAAEGRLPELLTVVTATRTGGAPPAVSGVPVALYRTKPRLRTALGSVTWPDGRLQISGNALRAPTSTGRPGPMLRALWLREQGQARRPLPARAQSRLLRSRTVQPAVDDLPAWSGFAASIPARALRSAAGWRPGTWLVMTGVVDRAGQPTTGPVQVGEIVPALPAAWVAPGVRIVPVLHDGALRLRVERPVAWATAVRVHDDHLVIGGAVVAGGTVPLTLTLSRTPQVVWRRYPTTAEPGPDGTTGPGGAAFSCRIPLADLRAGVGPQTAVGTPVQGWLVGCATGDGLDPGGADRELPVGDGFVELHPAVEWPGLLVEPADHGQLSVRLLPAGPLVTWASVDDSGLTLGGACVVGGAPSLVVLRHAADLRDAAAPADRELPVEAVDEGWLVRVPATGPDRPDPGRWWFGFRPADGDQVRELPMSLRVREGLGLADAAAPRSAPVRLVPDRLHRVALVSS
ncbi:glycosyltransferase family 2 protein [Micromonospora sp. NBC_01813]|uniref:glycosyltransferase family 2 protein n=1 Tax=Micromonospora sp. NBC_01813 TaxID=2975988 RepID=UPI002DD9E486|nr:glycosyltransferase family 2 protein [Micromonospora sp. NBC_01813]WSA08053.1 glycosyltransferase [Micromonospora sp. NBC_01813]